MPAHNYITLQLQQERKQVVRSNKEVRRIPTESNGTPGMDLGFHTHTQFCFGFCFWSLCRHTASPTIKSGTHTGGVQE